MLTKILSFGSALLVALVIASCSQQDEGVSVRSPSILLINANIVDGTGNPATMGAVRIEGELIVDVGALEPIEGERVINAGGLVLAPGFIDTHSHHDNGLGENLDAFRNTTQVALILVGSHKVFSSRAMMVAQQRSRVIRSILIAKECPMRSPKHLCLMYTIQIEVDPCYSKERNHRSLH